MPVDVAHALLGRKPTRPIEHRGGHVDPGYSLRIRSEGANDKTWPTGDIENCVFRTGLSRVHNHLQRAFVVDHGGGTEGQCLAGKLVQDYLPLCRHATALTPA